MLFIVYGMYISMCVYDTVTSSCELTLFWGVVRLQGLGLYKYHEYFFSPVLYLTYSLIHWQIFTFSHYPKPQ